MKEEPMTLTELIARLQDLANSKGDYDASNAPVKLCFDGDEFYITDARIVIDPEYNFDEANCGPDVEVQLCYIF